ncbi:enoyl-CoA hydratase/isomerase family protein [Peribacillus sp. SCS-26]|uniref:enoyl-CoA hydratase/isomerase family protein n=1 Tax=Paraperibacillus marinus TaxID=3115295 RepID=UPI003905933E
MQQNHLLINIQNRIMHLTLNRPESLNSFSPDMIAGLTKAFREAGRNPEVRAVILSGSGRSFSAGGDVKTMGTAGPGEVYDHIGLLNECILSIKGCEKPVLAAVHGFAAGAGFNLALACDLIIAAEDSQFALSFSKVGLVSDGGGSYFLTRLVGPHLAKELFFTGRPFDAPRLHQLGIVNAVFPKESLQEEVFKTAAELAGGPRKAFGMIKKLVDISMTASLEEVLEQERITQTFMVSTDDHEEGVQAFKEKRKPVFTGR